MGWVGMNCSGARRRHSQWMECLPIASLPSSSTEAPSSLVAQFNARHRCVWWISNLNGHPHIDCFQPSVSYGTIMLAVMSLARSPESIWSLLTALTYVLVELAYIVSERHAVLQECCSCHGDAGCITMNQQYLNSGIHVLNHTQSLLIKQSM